MQRACGLRGSPGSRAKGGSEEVEPPILPHPRHPLAGGLSLAWRLLSRAPQAGPGAEQTVPVLAAIVNLPRLASVPASVLPAGLPLRPISAPSPPPPAPALLLSTGDSPALLVRSGSQFPLVRSPALLGWQRGFRGTVLGWELQQMGSHQVNALSFPLLSPFRQAASNQLLASPSSPGACRHFHVTN